MLITRSISIDMGHRLPNYKGRCWHPHGHRYTIEVGVNDKVSHAKGKHEEGMVIDFAYLKEVLLKQVDEPLDHAFMIHHEDPWIAHFKAMQKDGAKVVVVDFMPTAENIAKFIYEKMKKELMKRKIALHQVTVCETPNCSATYSIDDEMNEKR